MGPHPIAAQKMTVSHSYHAQAVSLTVIVHTIRPPGAEYAVATCICGGLVDVLSSLLQTLQRVPVPIVAYEPEG